MQNEQNDRHGSIVLVITGVCGSIFFIYCGYLIAAMIGYVQEYSTDALTGAYVILSKPFDKYFNQFTPITMILGFIIFECIFFLMVIRKRIPQEENGNVLVNPEVIDVAEESFSQNTLENPNRIFDEMLRESDNSGSDMNETGYVSPDFVSKEDLQDFHMSATGNMQNKNSNDETMISADGAILIGLVDNNASVNIDSRNNAEHRHAKITALGAGGIVINAQSTQEYDRLAGLWGDIEKIYGDFGKFIDAVKDDPDVPQEKKDDLEYKVQKFGEAVQYLRSGIKKSTGLDVADYTVSVSSHPTTLTGAALTLLSLAAGIEQSVASLSQGYQAEAKTIVKSLENQVLMFLTPEKYANFAASSAVGTAAEGSITAAGSFNLNLLDNNARVTQNLGLHNCRPPEEVKSFVRRWQKNVISKHKEEFISKAKKTA